ncbi:DsbA family protein [Pseudaestuariivita rosea]|uniref:DsbA family protein n=1 Tax=Pseudaestuariivita rosea TaxID=2763263 RepID=UPI001ABA9BBE|nr:DsbA family protein [Pseudaestuariivita rosea]
MRYLYAPLTALTLALPAQALDLDNMTDAERDAFGQAVRSYLLENPEVLSEVVQELENRQAIAQAAQDQEMISANAEAIFGDDHSWVGGNPEGDVTMVEFIDYRCGFCRRAHSEVTELVETDGNIRLVIKEFPILGEQSEISSRFAIATLQLGGPEAYKQAHDTLITMRNDLTAASITRLAQELNLDPMAVTERMGSDQVTQVIAENRALAQTMGISGTPTFIVEDEMLRGYLPLEDMRNIVQDVRAN